MITRRGAVTTACVVLFWMVAAVLVLSIPRGVPSPLGGGAATIAVLVATAFAYMRLTARDAGVTHALGVGVAWLVLSMSVEIGMARYLGHPWYALLGSPDRPLLRNVFLFVWIFAPALFATSEERP